MCQKLKKSSLRLMSFLLSLLVASTCIFLSDKPVKALVGIDDALLWAAFTAGSFAGTAGEAALTGKIAHDEYGVKFGSQSQAQNFVKDFFTWALQSGGPLALTPQGQLANAAGQVVFTTGYKALAPHSVAARSALSQALSLFIGGVKSGTIQTLSYVTGNTINYQLGNGVYQLSQNYVLVHGMTYTFTFPKSGPAYTFMASISGYPYLLHMADWNANYPPLNDYKLTITTGSDNTVTVASSNVPISTFSSSSADFQVGGGISFICYGNPNSTYSVTVNGVNGSLAPDYSGVSTSGTIAMPVAGSLNPSVPIGLGAQTDDYPMNDVINGADTSYADEQAGTLENVDASQLDAADAAEAEGDTAIDPANDWTKPKDGIDWSPLENLALTTKFPFSLPFDFYNLASSLNASGVAPQFTIPFHFPNLPDASYTIDFSQYEWFVSKMRVFLYIVFLGSWIFAIYKVIKH